MKPHVAKTQPTCDTDKYPIYIYILYYGLSKNTSAILL